MAICFGPEMQNAERLQVRSGAKQIRISEEVYSQLEGEAIRAWFKKNGDSYVATDLTFPEIDRVQEENAARAGTLGAAARGPEIVVTTDRTKTPGDWHNSKPWRAR